MKKKIVSKRLTIGLSQKDLERLDSYCAVNELTYSETIRHLIREAIPSDSVS